MQRLTLLVAALFCATVTFAQDLQQKVTYRADTLPLKTVCEQLSEKTGVKLSTTAQLSPFAIVIDVKDVSLKDLMDRLAEAVEAEWVTETTTLRLNRSSAYIRKREQEAYQKRLAAVKKDQADSKAALAKLPAFDRKSADSIVKEAEELQRQSTQNQEDPKRYEAADKLLKQTPRSRFAERIAVAMDPEFLASLKSDDRVVLSTIPNRMQRAMPSSVMPIIAQFIREQNIWADALSGLPEPNYEEEDENNWYSDRLLNDRKAIRGNPAKVLIILTAQSGASVSMEVRLLNNKGGMIAGANASVSLKPEMSDEDIKKYTEQAAKIQEDSAKEEPLKLSPLAEELRKKLGFSFMREEGADPEADKPLSPELRNALLNPEKIDPLSLGGSEILLAIAQKKNLQLVAAPGDLLFLLAAMPSDEKGIKPAQLLAMMSTMPGDTNPVTLDDGWFVFRRGDFDGSLTQFGNTDRSLLGRITRKIAQEGRITLDTNCEIVLAQEENSYFSLLLFYGMIIQGNSGLDMFMGGNSRGNESMMRLHGLLTPIQKNELLQGGRISIGSLSPKQREILYNMVYKENRFGWDMEMTAPSEAEIDAPEDEDPDVEYAPQEPTEEYPNGLPSEGYITLKLEKSPTLFVELSYDGKTTRQEQMDPQEIGYYLAMREVGTGNPETDEYYKLMTYKSFQLGEKTDWQYKFTFAPKKSRNHALSDSKPTGSKLKSMDQLPPDLLKEINKVKEETIKEYKQRPPGDGGGGGGLLFRAMEITSATLR